MSAAPFTAVFGDWLPAPSKLDDSLSASLVRLNLSSSSPVMLTNADQISRTDVVKTLARVCNTSPDALTDSAAQYALVSSQLEDTVSFFLYVVGLSALNLPAERHEHIQSPDDATASVTQIAPQLLVSMQDAGLIGNSTESAFARSADKLMDRLVRECWRRKYRGRSRQDSDFDPDEEMEDAFDPKQASSVVDNLKHRVRSDFVPYIRFILGPHPPESSEWMGILTATKSKLSIDWEAIAMEKLGRLLSTYIYDLVESCPIAEGIMFDLKTCITTPAARRFLSEHFHRDLAKRLLHPGRSTVEILEMYMNCISTFQELDPSGIILSRAAEPIRVFLRMRTDTMRLILTSLLEPYRDDDGNLKPSTETFSSGVAECMDVFADFEYKEYYEAMDLRDIAWEPEPVDAAVGHQKTRTLDALSHLITLDSPDEVIKELQNVLCERLLADTSSKYEMEMRLLRTFKNRFEELKMQYCEIMLQDAIYSQRLERDIHQGDASMGAVQENGRPAGAFYAMMLSRYYWPPLQEQTFKLPPVIEEQMDAFHHSFRSIKPTRRLAWYHGLGKAHVELELEDRTVDELVTTWQAAVIHQFHDCGPAGRTVQHLVAALDMDEPLVRAALAFWVGKLVLRADPSTPDSYTVLERLAPPPDASKNAASPARAVSAATTSSASLAAAQAQAQAAAASALKSAADLLAENATVYGNFVAGMLTNQGGMPGKRIHMMLKMVVPGGFPFSEEELTGFLVGLEAEQRIERNGGVWRMKRK